MGLFSRNQIKPRVFISSISIVIASTLNHVGLVQAMNVDEKVQKEAEITLELNKVELVGEGCRLTFLTANQSDVALSKVAFEFAFLDQNGQLETLATLNFGAISPKRPKITQFTLPDQKCAALSRAFINSEAACDGAEKNTCLENVVTKNKTSIDF